MVAYHVRIVGTIPPDFRFLWRVQTSSHDAPPLRRSGIPGVVVHAYSRRVVSRGLIRRRHTLGDIIGKEGVITDYPR
ncbi:MAG: hypothetical protein IH892_18390 [Planctomycetes bacterium]|nr:hypothetical protein [Planctomycetota bacterium]